MLFRSKVGGGNAWAVGRAIDADLDRLNLPPGSVLLDTFEGNPIVLNSSNPSQFVITSDRDFQAVVDDPAAFRVQYVLVPPPTGLGGLDSINRAHPGFFENGAGMATLVREYGPASVWRLYRINP